MTIRMNHNANHSIQKSHLWSIYEHEHTHLCADENITAPASSTFSFTYYIFAPMLEEEFTNLYSWWYPVCERKTYSCVKISNLYEMIFKYQSFGPKLKLDTSHQRFIDFHCCLHVSFLHNNVNFINMLSDLNGLLYRELDIVDIKEWLRFISCVYQK